MDAKQVWRAALGELQVSLSPANFETWLKETALVAVDDNRFRVAVPNGFAKDWLETRYRSLISQTLARVVGYSVQVDFEVREGLNAAAEDTGETSAVIPPPASMRRRLAETAEKEQWNGQTLVGPHRDDISFVSGARDLSGFASRGQQRTAILAFKLAELDLLTAQDGRPPLLLLDDV